MNENNIPEIKLSDLTPTKINNLAEGYKIKDTETGEIYEKRNGSMKIVISEEDLKAEEGVSKMDAKDIDIDVIEKLVATGDKIEEANAFMKLQSAKSALKSQKAMINDKVNFMFAGTPEQMDIVQARTSEITEDAIANASIDQLKEFFVIDGNDIELNFREMLSEKEIEEAYRDFLLYLKSVNDTAAEIDKHVKNIEELCTHFSPEIQEKSKNIAEWDQYIYDLFKARLEEPNLDQATRDKIIRLVSVKEESLDLSPILTYVKNEIALGRRNSIINAYHTRMDDTIKKAEEYAQKNKFSMYFNMFEGLEEIFGYTENRNFFLYLLARYVKFNSANFSKIDNAFVAQIVQNCIMLKKKEMQVPNRTKFINSLKAIIDAVIETNNE